jgi:hypothetical protein
MSKHKVIIITPPPGGGNLVASGGATVTVEYSPGHDLTPAQERRRTEWAEKQAEKIIERLNSPAGEEAHVE